MADVGFVVWVCSASKKIEAKVRRVFGEVAMRIGTKTCWDVGVAVEF